MTALAVRPASGAEKRIDERWWNKPRSLAAQLLAEDELPDREICARIKKSPTWLAELKRMPHVQERITDIRRAIADAILQHGIAVKANRVAGLNKLAEEVRAVIDERGMIERTTTTTENAEIVRERFARELPAELRAIYHAAAEETGQLQSPAPAPGDGLRREIVIREYAGNWAGHID